MISRSHRSNFILAGISAAVLLVAAHGAIAEAVSGGPARGPAIVVPDCLLTGSQLPEAPIDVRFVTAPGTSVDLASLRIWVHQFSGWVDVTDMLLRHPGVRVGRSGIHLDGGVLPAGQHEVRLSFHDTKGQAVDETKTIRIAQFGGGGSF